MTIPKFVQITATPPNKNLHLLCPVFLFGLDESGLIWFLHEKKGWVRSEWAFVTNNDYLASNGISTEES